MDRKTKLTKRAGGNGGGLVKSGIRTAARRLGIYKGKEKVNRRQVPTPAPHTKWRAAARDGLRSGTQRRRRHERRWRPRSVKAKKKVDEVASLSPSEERQPDIAIPSVVREPIAIPSSDTRIQGEDENIEIDKLEKNMEIITDKIKYILATLNNENLNSQMLKIDTDRPTSESERAVNPSTVYSEQKLVKVSPVYPEGGPGSRSSIAPISDIRNPATGSRVGTKSSVGIPSGITQNEIDAIKWIKDKIINSQYIRSQLTHGQTTDLINKSNDIIAEMVRNYPEYDTIITKLKEYIPNFLMIESVNLKYNLKLNKVKETTETTLNEALSKENAKFFGPYRKDG